MKKVKVSIVTRAWLEVPACPLCDAEPEISTNMQLLDTLLSKEQPEALHEVVCPVCGLSAPLKVWKALAEKTGNHSQEEHDEGNA